MRAAVVGTNWGQVHVRALRHHGVDVVALAGSGNDGGRDAGRTAAVARDLQVPLAVRDPRALLDLDLDLICVATPPTTHAPLLRLFRTVPVICEKPLLGVAGDAALLPAEGAAVWVNYAFPFLDTARECARIARLLGSARSIAIDTAFDLAGEHSPAGWFLELASHPLSFAVHLYGTPRLADGAAPTPRGDALGLDLVLGGAEVPARVTCRPEAGIDGIVHAVRITTEAGVVALEGVYRTGQPWSYGPVRVDGSAVGEPEAADDEVWARANIRSIGTAVRAVRGEMSAADGVAAGLCTMERARAIDDCVRTAFPEESP